MAQAGPIHPGDIVQLKSGGPTMTVDSDFDSNSVICVWFDGKKKLSDVFQRNSLTRAD